MREDWTLPYRKHLDKTAAATGGAGDIIYGLPAMRQLGIKRLYVKESFYHPPMGSLYTTVKPLLELQGIETMPTAGAWEGKPLDYFQYEPGLKFDYDLDAAKNEPHRGSTHIMLSYLYHYNLPTEDWWKPWLKGIPVTEEDFSLVFLTTRWRTNSQVDWTKVYASIPRPVYFIGFEEDHERFCTLHGKIDWLQTKDVLEMAQLIARCRALYTNQSISVVLAQGLGKEYYLEKKPKRTNVEMPMAPNEHLL